MQMQTAIATSFAATAEACPTWLKDAARATFLFIFIKSVVWLAALWLAFRGI